MIETFTEITEVHVWKTGLWQVVRKQLHPRPTTPPPERSDSRRWSKKSKRRFIARIARSKIKMQSMITLTFPDRCRITDGKHAKKVLNRFLVSLRRKFPEVEYWWVQEFQKNGQPHFHVFVNLGKEYINRTWLGRYWAQAMLWKAPDSWATHRVIAEDVFKVHKHPKAWQVLRSKDGAQRYLLSYIGKEYQKTPPEDYENVGRWWGCSKGLRGDTPPDESWPIDDGTLRVALKSWGLGWIAEWDYIPEFIHTLPE